MNTEYNIMVCVTQQKTCERLIRRGAQIRDQQDGELFVIHVAKEGEHFLGKSKEGDALEYLFEKSKAYGANLTVVRSHDVLTTLGELAQKNNIHLIILGESYENEDKNVVNKLQKKLSEGIEIEIVPVQKKEKVS
ncbi:universal stress protein UspA [Inediibacterium massiliense]|uniref:universal stress protein UspA n=1 Tax=Inediibacterium massiliense TaxID=1658111 RepID=UPI0006B5FF9A|nr:universal stress protein UspA [Inediibacterium massiliense]